MWWHLINSIAVAALLALAGGLSQSANAQAQTAVAQNDCGCWIDTKTGKSVRTAPISGVNISTAASLGAGTAVIDDFDPNRAFNSRTGQNFVRVPCPPPEAAKTTSPEKEKPKELPEKKEVGLGSEPPATETTSAKPSEEPKKVEEKKESSWWEFLIPALIPSIGIGVGRERDRRQPSNPCSGK